MALPDDLETTTEATTEEDQGVDQGTTEMVETASADLLRVGPPIIEGEMTATATILFRRVAVPPTAMMIPPEARAVEVRPIATTTHTTVPTVAEAVAVPVVHLPWTAVPDTMIVTETDTVVEEERWSLVVGVDTTVILTGVEAKSEITTTDVEDTTEDWTGIATAIVVIDMREATPLVVVEASMATRVEGSSYTTTDQFLFMWHLLKLIMQQ